MFYRPDGGMVDTKDLKSFGHCGCAGSSPAPGTEKRLCQNVNFGSASFSCVRILAISESKRSFTCFDEQVRI